MAKILEPHPDLQQLIEEFTNAQMELIELGRFSVGFRAGTQLMLEIMKEL